MKYHYLQEPLLEFGNGTHICPREGIALHGVYDAHNKPRRDNILIGAVGTNNNVEMLSSWIEFSSQHIPKKPSNQPALFPDFIGFNKHSGFSAEFILSDSNIKPLLTKEIERVLETGGVLDKINSAVDLYIEKIKFLAQNKNPEVVVCIISDALYKKIHSQRKAGIDDGEVDDHLADIETNFRRMLKARAMKISNIPIQLVRENTLKGNPKGTGTTQDDATTAWNLCTALYYKSSNSTIPWKLSTDSNKPLTCYAGISFYRSRDKKVVYSSLAQIFDEMGRNVILRGTPVDVNKADRRPHLSANQAYDLLSSAINEYRIAMNTNPARLVIHKTSKYSEDEAEGFRGVVDDIGIDMVDLISLGDSPIRLFRHGAYPPYRGSMVDLDTNKLLLYTRGSVPFFETYPGKYIPQPLEVDIYQSESSPRQVAEEILALTKMNWNNTQFDRKYPVTIECARNVGKIIKYLDPTDLPQANYRFYM